MPGKEKWLSTLGLMMKESAYGLPGTEPIDFTGTLNVPATTGTQRFVLFNTPPAQTLAALLGSNDVYQNLLAASTGSRVANQYGTPIGVFANPTLFSSSGAGAVVAYASTFTLQITILAFGTSGAGVATNLLTAALALNSLTNPATALSLTSVPSDRQVLGSNGSVLSNCFYVFPGDVITVLFSNTGASAVTVAAGNVLSMGFELF